MDIVVEKTGTRAVVRMNGRFDIQSNLTFRNVTKPLLEDAEVITMVIDFAEVRFVDSSALGLLLLLWEQAKEANKEIVLANCSADLRRVLSISQFHKIFHIQ